MNLKDLNSKILDLMPIQKIKGLVKSLAEKLEQSNQKIDVLKDENKELKSKLRELIGEQELPTFKPKKKKNSKERDPNPEYKEPKKKGPGRGKRGKKNHKIKISRKEKLEINKSELPDDAVFKGYRNVLVQEIEFRTDNIEFSIPRYYSPSLKKYFEPQLPQGYRGFEFGPKLRAFVLMMNTQCRVTENKIKSIFDTIGTYISIGHINKITQTIPTNILTEMLTAKETAIKKVRNIHADASGININGDGRYLQCICNNYFSWFDLLKNRSRYEVLKGIIGSHHSFKYIIDQAAINWLLGRMKENRFIAKLREHLSNNFYTETEFNVFLDKIKVVKKKRRRQFKTAALLSAYQSGLFGTQITGLVSDDADEYKDIVRDHQFCWIHELRHYRVSTIATGFTREILDAFFTRAWKFYELMKSYKYNPCLKLRRKITREFKKLFETKWDCHSIDSIQKNTIERKNGLLKFLDNPSLEIHNNSCEFDIREKVVKKKISYGHKSEEGCRNGNFWLSLYHTCRKNSVGLWQYLIDRYSGENLVPQLSVIIQNS